MYQYGKRKGSPDAQMHTDYITGSGFLLVADHGLWRNSERKGDWPHGAGTYSPLASFRASHQWHDGHDRCLRVSFEVPQ